MVLFGKSSIFSIILASSIFLIKIENCIGKECNSGIDRNKLTPLSIYTNNLTGPYHDRFATTLTKKVNVTALINYKFNATLGLVSTSPLLSTDLNRCECLIKIVQMYDEQVGWGGTSDHPGPFGRFDHKLIRENTEPSLLFENYKPTGEELYCVMNSGECDATVPLYKWFDIADIDSFYSTTQTPNFTALVRSDGLLCYIWPINGDSESAPIDHIQSRTVIVTTDAVPSTNDVDDDDEDDDDNDDDDGRLTAALEPTDDDQEEEEDVDEQDTITTDTVDNLR